MDVLSGLTTCINKCFRDMFNHLKQNTKLDNLQILGTVPLDASPMEQIKAILDKAVDIYKKHCIAQIWNSMGKGGPHTAASVTVERKCWNCNDPDHQAQTCPKLQNKALFEMNHKSQRNQGIMMVQLLQSEAPAMLTIPITTGRTGTPKSSP